MTRERNRWLAALLLAALLMSLSFACCRMVYETNDDSSIVAAASGAVTGSPYAGNGFTSYLYGALLAFLFSAVPSLPWHALILLGLIYLSVSALIKSYLTLCNDRSIPCSVALILFAALYVGVLLPYVVMLQFTTVPSLAASAGCCLLLVSWPKLCRQKASFAIGIFLLLFALMLRIQSAWVTIPLLLMFGLSYDFERKRYGKGILLFCAAVAVVFGLITLLDSYLYQWSDPAWAAFEEFNALHGSLLDYNNTDLATQASHELPEWTPWLTYMVRDWYMLDARMTEENLAALLNVMEAMREPLSLFAVLKAAGSLLLRYPVFSLSLAGFSLYALFASIRLLKKHRYWAVLRMIGIYVYLIVFVAYFYGILGRMPMRAAFTAGCPCYVLLLFNGLEAFEKDPDSPKNPISEKVLLTAVLALCIATPAINGNAFIPLRWKEQYHDRIRRSSELICEYVTRPENADTLYLTDVTLDFSPAYVHGDRLPSNLLSWRCGMYHSPLYHTKLEKFGYERFTSENLFDENVLLLVQDASALTLLYEYLETDYAPVELETVDIGACFTVYRIHWKES